MCIKLLCSNNIVVYIDIPLSSGAKLLGDIDIDGSCNSCSSDNWLHNLSSFIF